MQECDVRDVPDGLFLERLEAFMEKSLADIGAFAGRENRSFEEIRRHVAEWHAKYLFKREPAGVAAAAAAGATNEIRSDQVGSVLCDTSRILESLREVAGVHSFLLAVDPDDSNDQGFLGGTVLGREFWRGLRGGGDVGAKNFKQHCLKEVPPKNDISTDDLVATTPNTQPTTVPTSKRAPANAVKTEIYANVRSALRTVSGIRNAEMKWTNHDRLSVYGVRIVGWPRDIPLQNPSTLSSSQNKALLASLKNGSLRFVRTTDQNVDDSADTSNAAAAEDEGDLSWVYENIAMMSESSVN